jgi:hypothetical protein
MFRSVSFWQGKGAAIKTQKILVVYTALLMIAGAGRANAAPITNPLMPDTLLFVIRDVCPASRNGIDGAHHMCDQYFGFNACGKGSVYLLTGCKSGDTRLIDLLANARVQNGRLKDKSLAGGGFLSPELSFDGKTILFACVEKPGAAESWAVEQCFHIFKINSDGTNLFQVTDGPYNDFDPCFLPNGRIVFVSERRGGYGRCHPRLVPTYTMFSMKDDGSDIVCISYHETNEWHPSVTGDGMIVYSRWDYIDRDDCIAHNMWVCYPDGCDPRSMHANYPEPLTTMTGSGWPDGRNFRPWTEANIRAIPNSNAYVAIGTGHHSQAYGDVIIIDPTIPDDNRLAQVTGVTTKKTSWGDSEGRYATPWPLSADYFLCNKDSSIILIDKNGNEQTVYKSTLGRPLDPIPFRQRTKPPVLTAKTWQGERAGLPDHRMATISVLKADFGDMALPAGTVVKAIRIFQIIPQFTPLINQVRIGYASESLARLCLGTAPVESDGSAYFEAPVCKELYFQLIDSSGLAVQSMRTGTYVHPGEQLTCVGCHENKWLTPPVVNPLATRRAPSKLVPEVGAEPNGVTPINYYRLAKPVLDAKCTPCHAQQAKGPDMSYASLQNYAFWWPGPGNPYVNGDIVTALHGGSRSVPGKLGARVASLYNFCKPSPSNPAMTAEELRRVTLWLDGNSNELSAYSQVAQQQAGKLVWPELDFDPNNPTGVETGLSSPTVNPPSPAGVRNQRYFTVRDNRCTFTNITGGSVRVKLLDARGKVLLDRSCPQADVLIELPVAHAVCFLAVYGNGRLIDGRVWPVFSGRF